MSVRSPPLFALALACLVAATALGTLLYYDGEVGTAASLDFQEVGHDVRVKGTLTDLDETPPKLAPHLLRYTKVLHLEQQPEVLVLLTSQEPLPEGSALVEGLLVDAGSLHQRPYMVVHASVVREPLVFA